MTEGKIRQTAEDFAAVARDAIDAVFSTAWKSTARKGYLLQQFLATNANQRTDRWGGSPADRIRLTVEVVTAVTEAIGASRTGLARLAAGVPLAEADMSKAYGGDIAGCADYPTYQSA